MKKTITLLCAGFLSVSVFASDAGSEKSFEEEVSGDDCFAKVSQVTRPKLDELRSWMASKKAKDGKTYNEIYRLYKGHFLSAKAFEDIRDDVDSIRLSAIFAINSCNKAYGDMHQADALIPENVDPSAMDRLQNETLPKILAFYDTFDAFVKSHYNVYVAR